MGTVRRQCGDKDRSKGSKDSVMETLTTITTILAALVLFRTPFSNFILNSIPNSILQLRSPLPISGGGRIEAELVELSLEQ